jgi:LysR family transcriptional regulator, benzoate and cis,cis-muconate-responsive activator of ben and cat genes
MELRHLRYFVAVAETENVSRAALKLHVSQPALSRQIRDLEDEIGFCLLERTAKSVRLTDAGHAFLNDARTLLQQADEAVKKARAIASAEPTELKVGYSPAATARILAPILRAYQRVMPKVHVKLHDWSNEENVAGLRDGRLNLAFVVRPPKAVFLEETRFEELIRERICLAVPPHHPFATRQSVSLADAASEPFVGLTREEYPDFHNLLSVIFGRVKTKPHLIEEHDSMSGVMSSVEAGIGIAIGAEAFGYSLGNRVKLLRLTPEPKPISVGIAARKGRLSLATEKFWQCAKEAAAATGTQRNIVR